MFIKFNGEMSIEQLIPNLMEVVGTVSEKVKFPKGTKLLLQDVTIKVVMDVNGEHLYATVDREVNGETATEMLAFELKLGNDGNIIKSLDNEEASFYDDKTIAKALGKDYIYTTIETAFSEDQLELLDEFKFDEGNEELKVCVYRIKESGKGLVQYYKGGKLVGETTMLEEFIPEYLSKKK